MEQPWRFPHPEPSPDATPVYPVFIPFAGCPARCLFCEQEAQTGRQAVSPERTLHTLESEFTARSSRAPMDLAFYGGTFTALPWETQKAFLGLAARLKDAGLIRRTRCSTRPDAVTPASLSALRRLGLDDLELGVQSFSSAPLRASKRGYTGQKALDACRMVQKAGLGLGVQLMPGMPGMEEEHWKQDLDLCLRLKPAMTRLYPCLVLEGTLLAEEWCSGRFRPWDMECILRLLPPALLALWENDIRVIRLGLHPEKGLQEKILAGPWRPTLGQSLRGRALLLHVSGHISKVQQNLEKALLLAPRKAQGDFFGHGRELEPQWSALGISKKNIRWINEGFFELLPATARQKQVGPQQHWDRLEHNNADKPGRARSSAPPA